MVFCLVCWYNQHDVLNPNVGHRESLGRGTSVRIKRSRTKKHLSSRFTMASNTRMLTLTRRGGRGVQDSVRIVAVDNCVTLGKLLPADKAQSLVLCVPLLRDPPSPLSSAAQLARALRCCVCCVCVEDWEGGRGVEGTEEERVDGGGGGGRELTDSCDQAAAAGQVVAGALHGCRPLQRG
eukprot:3934900-Rhodomonas_salina.2